MPAGLRITAAYGRHAERVGSLESERALLAVAQVCARLPAPSPVLLGTLAELYARSGRSVGRLAKRTRSTRQAVRRWIRGQQPRTRRARAALKRLAASLVAPEGLRMVPQSVDRQRHLEAQAAAQLLRACGWSEQAVAAYSAGATLPLPTQATPANPAAVLTRAAELFDLHVPALLSGGGRSARSVAARRAVAVVLDGLGYSTPAIGAVLHLHHSSVANLLGRIPPR